MLAKAWHNVVNEKHDKKLLKSRTKKVVNKEYDKQNLWTKNMRQKKSVNHNWFALNKEVLIIQVNCVDV